MKRPTSPRMARVMDHMRGKIENMRQKPAEVQARVDEYRSNSQARRAENSRSDTIKSGMSNKRFLRRRHTQMNSMFNGYERS